MGFRGSQVQILSSRLCKLLVHRKLRSAYLTRYGAVSFRYLPCPVSSPVATPELPRFIECEKPLPCFGCGWSWNWRRYRRSRFVLAGKQNDRLQQGDSVSVRLEEKPPIISSSIKRPATEEDWRSLLQLYGYGNPNDPATRLHHASPDSLCMRL